MSATWKLFEMWREAKGYESVRQGVLALGLDPSTATLWKNGRNGSADVIERMAKELGQDPIGWNALVMAEREQGEAGRAWARMAKRLGAAAALVFLVGGMSPSPAAAQCIDSVDFSRTMYIMSILRRAVRGLFRLPASFTPLPA